MKLVKVAKATQHPQYDAKTEKKKKKKNIAVLQLAGTLEFGPTISAVELPSSEEEPPTVGATWSVTGWGTTSQGGSFPSNLMVAYVDIIDHERCVKEYASRNQVDDSMICAGVLGGGKDACQGDGGGPLVEVSSKKQVGVVSWGFGCGQAGQDGVYNSTAAYSAWIQATLETL